MLITNNRIFILYVFPLDTNAKTKMFPLLAHIHDGSVDLCLLSTEAPEHGNVVAHLCQRISFRWLWYLKTVLQKKKVPVNEIKAAMARTRMMSRWWYW